MVCLDTCFLIDFLREQRNGKAGRTSKKFSELKKKSQTPKTTTINPAELYFGAYYTDSNRILGQIDAIARQLEILTIYSTVAKHAAAIAAQL